MQKKELRLPASRSRSRSRWVKGSIVTYLHARLADAPLLVGATNWLGTYQKQYIIQTLTVQLLLAGSACGGSGCENFEKKSVVLSDPWGEFQTSGPAESTPPPLLRGT